MKNEDTLRYEPVTLILHSFLFFYFLFTTEDLTSHLSFVLDQVEHLDRSLYGSFGLIGIEGTGAIRMLLVCP